MNIPAKDLRLAFDKAEKAITSLGKSLQLSSDVEDLQLTYQDSTIQRFEYSIELMWKLLKKILLADGIEANTPREVMVMAYQANILHHEKLWLSMLFDRNQTSHAYNESLAIEIYNNIKNIYYKELKETLESIQARIIG